MRCKDKVAVVTGAASGFGAATARRFAEEGAKVVAADINEAGLTATLATVEAAGGQGISVPVDVTQGGDIKAMASEILGVAKSMGLTCEGKDPKEIQASIKSGELDDRFS